MKPRPSRQELIDRMMRRVPNPELQQDLALTEPQEQLSAFVEVGLTRHPLQCWRYTIYDMIRS